MKRKFKLKISSSGGFLLFVAICFLVIVWIGIATFNELKRKQEVLRELASIRATVEETEKENQELSRKIESFESEETIERMARERLNLKKPDEHVAIIVPDENKKKEQNGLQKDESSGKLNFLKNLFKILGRLTD